MTLTQRTVASASDVARYAVASDRSSRVTSAARDHRTRSGPIVSSAQRCRRAFLRVFPEGFRDATYVAWERGYKWEAHERWQATLNKPAFRTLLRTGRFAEAAHVAVSIESRTNLMFSFEKIALRDAVRSSAGARLFATGLYDFLHGAGDSRERFMRWCAAVSSLPRKQTRVFTWPIVTVFGFIAEPRRHMFLKPLVTRVAADRYGFDFHYESTPSWATYESLLQLAKRVREDVRDLRPRDMIDVQSFLWVLGSDEYAY